MRIGSFILLFGMIVLVFDGIWSIVAQRQGLEYGSLWWVSMIVYSVAGFCAARHAPWWAGWSVGAAVAGLDATVGWLLSALIGPGHPGGNVTWGTIIVTIISVLLVGSIAGVICALVARVSLAK